MRYYMTGSNLNRSYYISHHGIKGQRWGIRRFQNDDGTLTSEGKERYNEGKITRELNRNELQIASNKTRKAAQEENAAFFRKIGAKKAADAFEKNIKKTDERIKDGEDRAKTLLSLASEKKYSISSTEVTRYTNAGMVAVMALSVSGLPYAAITLGSDVYSHQKYGGDHGGFVKGKRYRSNY